MLGWFKKKLKKDSSPEKIDNENKPLPEQSGNDLESQTSIKPEPLHHEKSEKSPHDSSANQGAAEEIEDHKELKEEAYLPEQLLDNSENGTESAIQPVNTDKQETASEFLPDKQDFSDAKPKKRSLFKKLSEKLSRTRESFTHQLDSLFLGKKEIDADLLDDLEEILITADLGISITDEVLDYARKKVKRNELSDASALKDVLKEKLKSYIVDNDKPAELVMPDEGPFVIMVVGVNGVGKTTTIGKIARKFINAGQSVLLVAGDTFRAAAVSQLTIWAERNGVDIISKEDADPSSVAFDAMDKAKNGNYDVVLVDTAGRLHTQTNLMDELKKIKKVIAKRLEGAPHEVMLVIDATTGQNGISQAKLFDAAVDITGITLTKLDGTAKGGIVANISKEMKTPIRFIGVGEQVEDLRDFNPDEFIDALFHSDINN